MSSFLDPVPMSSLLISNAPIEIHRAEAEYDVSTGDMRIADEAGRLGEGAQDEPSQFERTSFDSVTSFGRRIIEVLQQRKRSTDLSLNRLEQRISHLRNRLDMATAEEKGSLHRAFQAHDVDPSVRSSASDVLYNNMPWVTRSEIIRERYASAISHLPSSCAQCPIVHGDLKPANILLDSRKETMFTDFRLLRVLHADDYTPIPMGRAVPPHTAPPNAKFSGNPSAKRDTGINIGSHATHGQINLSVHRHPLIQMLRPACKWSDYVLTRCTRLITSKMIGEEGWISAKPKYETPNAGHVSKYNMIRKFFGIKNRLAANESQQHSGPDSRRANDRKMAVSTKTSAPWIVATAAPHHATGDRSLLSGFIMEFEDQFVHAVNRVPMKVLARGAVVTDALTLPDVWFVPGLTENVVSVSQLAELDHSIGFGRGECCIRSVRDAKIVGKGRLQKGGHYVLDYLKVPLAI